MLYINKHHCVYIIALGKQFGRGTQLYKDFNEWVQENGFQYETNVIKIGFRLLLPELTFTPPKNLNCPLIPVCSKVKSHKSKADVIEGSNR